MFPSNPACLCEPLFACRAPRHLASLSLESIFGCKSRRLKEAGHSVTFDKRKRRLKELTDLNIFTATSTLGLRQLRMNPGLARRHLNNNRCNPSETKAKSSPLYSLFSNAKTIDLLSAFRLINNQRER
jgi:hypothetical protein